MTRLLDRAADGESTAASDLLPLVYGELRKLAEACFHNERPNHTLQPTALVHDAFMRLVDLDTVKWESRRQFYALAARAMRNLLVDHARKRRRLKRGGDRLAVTLEVADHDAGEPGVVDMVALDDALTRLGELDARKASLVELRYFGGLSLEQAAEHLGIARSTASDSWRMARAWLYRELGGADAFP